MTLPLQCFGAKGGPAWCWLTNVRAETGLLQVGQKPVYPYLGRNQCSKQVIGHSIWQLLDKFMLCNIPSCRTGVLSIWMPTFFVVYQPLGRIWCSSRFLCNVLGLCDCAQLFKRTLQRYVAYVLCIALAALGIECV